MTEYKNSVLQLNRYFDSLAEWDESAIAKRGRGLGEAICKIWERPALINAMSDSEQSALVK